MIVELVDSQSGWTWPRKTTSVLKERGSVERFSGLGQAEADTSRKKSDILY